MNIASHTPFGRTGRWVRSARRPPETARGSGGQCAGGGRRLWHLRGPDRCANRNEVTCKRRQGRKQSEVKLQQLLRPSRLSRATSGRAARQLSVHKCGRRAPAVEALYPGGWTPRVGHVRPSGADLFRPGVKPPCVTKEVSAIIRTSKLCTLKGCLKAVPCQNVAMCGACAHRHETQDVHTEWPTTVPRNVQKELRNKSTSTKGLKKPGTLRIPGFLTPRRNCM